jgi:predicted small secreted protein
MKGRLIPIAMAAVAVVLVGCNPFGPTERQWTEDVLLDDGTTLKVRRTARFDEANALGGGAYSARETEATLAFTGRFAQLPAWSFPLLAIFLYRDVTRDNQWVIVASTTSCETWSGRGEPQPPYWEFRLGPQGWQEVPLSPTSINRTANLLAGYHAELPGKHITVIDREKHDARASERYRIVRAQAKSNCPHAVDDRLVPDDRAPLRTQ